MSISKTVIWTLFLCSTLSILPGCKDNSSSIKMEGKNVFVMDVCGDKTIKNPDHQTIADSLSKILTGICRENSFLIIGHSAHELSYVQVHYDTEERTFTIEYQDGSTERHFESTRKHTLKEVQDALEGYSADSKEWDKGISWIKIPIGS